ncbi:4589_t:CDS:2, partial [Paraglomus occultum]
KHHQELLLRDFDKNFEESEIVNSKYHNELATKNYLKTIVNALKSKQELDPVELREFKNI